MWPKVLFYHLVCKHTYILYMMNMIYNFTKRKALCCCWTDKGNGRYMLFCFVIRLIHKIKFSFQEREGRDDE